VLAVFVILAAILLAAINQGRFGWCAWLLRSAHFVRVVGFLWHAGGDGRQHADDECGADELAGRPASGVFGGAVMGMCVVGLGLTG
jgi:hypothetical protein